MTRLPPGCYSRRFDLTGDALRFNYVAASNEIPDVSVPTGLRARVFASQGAFGSEVVLTWDSSFGASNYVVKRAGALEGPYVVIATVRNPVYRDVTTQDWAYYYYVVSSVNDRGESPDSAPLAVGVPAPFGPAVDSGDNVFIDAEGNVFVL